MRISIANRDYPLIPKIPYLRYVMTSRDGRSSYLTVPDEQMRNFIAVAGNEQERVTFLDPAAVPVAEGDRVRITGGPFEGVEGVCVRMHNGRDRRVVVQIEGIVAVATTAIPATLIQKLENF